LTEDLETCDVILTELDVEGMTARARFGVVAQTTQPLDKVEHLVRRIEQRFPGSEIRHVDTVCQPTKLRQEAAVTLSKQCDVVVVIGGTQSNNTQELAATCRRHCERVVQVQTAEEMHATWFRLEDTVGITAGTSTPDESIAGVERWLQEFIDFQEQLARHAAAVQEMP
jgi:4-hydroxy-3-methylbut-2-enyl diphosphate reductase